MNDKDFKPNNLHTASQTASTAPRMAPSITPDRGWFNASQRNFIRMTVATIATVAIVISAQTLATLGRSSTTVLPIISTNSTTNGAIASLPTATPNQSRTSHQSGNTSKTLPAPSQTLNATSTVIPELLSTEIAYISRNLTPTSGAPQPATLNPTVSCMVTATSNLNLRSDPSTAHPPLLIVPAGTTLPVSSRSQDKFWWQISYNTGNRIAVGWISAQYVSNNGNCGVVSTLP